MSDEITEAELLLAQATFPTIRQLLSDHIDKLKSLSTKSPAAEPSSVGNNDGPQVDISNPVVNPEPKVDAEPKVVPAKREREAVAPLVGSFVPIENFAWDQGGYNSSTITILVELPGVGSVKQNCKIEFGKCSFDLTVEGLAGKNYRLIKDNLEKDINPSLSKIVVKKDKILIKLEKIKGEYSYEHWTNLTAKKKRDASEEAKKKDPMGGIMDMMKDMYDDGDENMKKIIGEAMLKSQRGEKSAPPSLDDM